MSITTTPLADTRRHNKPSSTSAVYTSLLSVLVNVMAQAKQARQLDHRSASPDAFGSALGEIDPPHDRYRRRPGSARAHYGHLWIYLTPLDSSPRRVAVSCAIL